MSRLGGGKQGQTVLARARDNREKCVIKILRAADRLTEETVERLQELVERVKGCDHPSIAAPFSCARIENTVVLVSRHVAGPHLGELVVRRGRLPAQVVWEIGRQLAEGLGVLAQRNVAHGDIRAANVRLTSLGTAVLVDAGVRPAVDPILTIHAGLAPERYDGLAPELIGGSVSPNARSDAYALGCLLWQLLAGRPPFPGGDSLVKIAAHQTRTIDDVRKWAPDTPPPLAEAIGRLTARKPADRPDNFTELLDIWHPPGRRGRRALAAFRRRFDSPAAAPLTGKGVSTPTRWLLALTALFALSGGVVTLADKGARNVALAWAANLSQSLREGARREEIKSRRPLSAGDGTGTLEERNDVRAGRALPAPDRFGVIRLDAAGPYRASDITTVGELTIEGDDKSRPQIVVDDRPLKLWAEKVTLKNVRIGLAAGGSASPPNLNALVLVQAQELAIEGCVFDSGATQSAVEVDQTRSAVAPPTGPALVAWKLLDASEPRGGSAAIRNTLLLGNGPGLYLSHAVRQVEFDNVLKVGASPLVQLAAVPKAKRSVVVRLAHTTCRASGALLRWIVSPESTPAGRVLIEADDCVFDVLPARAALFEFAGPERRPELFRSVRMTGEGSVSGPELEVAAWIAPEDGRLSPLAPTAVDVEGIFSGPFRFAGEISMRPADAEVVDCDAPRRTSDPPGIRASALPGFGRSEGVAE
jgi:hypothetical protein